MDATEAALRYLDRVSVPAERADGVYWRDGPGGKAQYRLSELGRVHYYCQSQENPDEIADFAWQQFLPEEARGLHVPSYLSGSRAEVAGRAALYGVIEPSVLELWTPAGQ
jgi:hypothetical protein